jgi:hypothetical protein
VGKSYLDLKKFGLVFHGSESKFYRIGPCLIGKDSIRPSYQQGPGRWRHGVEPIVVDRHGRRCTPTWTLTQNTAGRESGRAAASRTRTAGWLTACCCCRRGTCDQQHYSTLSHDSETSTRENDCTIVVHLSAPDREKRRDGYHDRKNQLTVKHRITWRRLLRKCSSIPTIPQVPKHHCSSKSVEQVPAYRRGSEAYISLMHASEREPMALTSSHNERMKHLTESSERAAASFPHPLNQPLLALALALAQDPSHKSRADRTRLGDSGLLLIELWRGCVFGV